MAYSFNITSGVLPSARTAYFGTRTNTDEGRFTRTNSFTYAITNTSQ